MALPLDVAAIALAELGGIAERRIEQCVNPALSGLPPFLAPQRAALRFHAGPGDGGRAGQREQGARHPACVDSIPSSAGGRTTCRWADAVRKLRGVVANVRRLLAIEILCAAQGIDLRADIAAPAQALGEVHAAIRRRVPRMDIDREVAGQIAVVNELLPDLVTTSATASGGLR